MSETNDEKFDNVMNINLRGVWNCMKAELRQMIAEGSGVIVNCSSVGRNEGIKRASCLRSRQIRRNRSHARGDPRLR
jgi:NAD(P)-dependent dehydrogenase (short-subunit alcohol dehydrogenase family)